MLRPTRSRPASQSSPETGDDNGFDASKPVEVELEVSRQRAITWTVFGLLFGSLLIWKLGTVGVWVGVLLVVLGVFRAVELVQTIMNPPGTIVVNEREVVLPRGLSLGKPVTVPRSAVTAVYFLRRSVPWNRSAPVLVIETGSRAFAFPRDWFASEADQRHIVHALLVGLEGSKAPPEDVPHHDDGKLMWAQLGGGLVLLGGGIAAWMAAATPISNAQYILYVAPIVAGWIFTWRGLMRW